MKKSYLEVKSAILDIANSKDPRDQAIIQREVDAILNLKIAPGEVHSSTLLSNLSVAYSNEAFIGEQLMPAINVSKLSDEFAIYTKRDGFAAPDDALGDEADANSVSMSISSSTFSCKGYGLKEFLSQKAIDNADAIFKTMVDVTEHVNELTAFKREKRIMTILTTSANFGSNTSAIAAADRWNSSGGGNPIKDILTARASVWRGPGQTKLVGYCSQEVYNALKTNPAILDVLKHTRPGTPTRQIMAELFELDDLLVSESWEDTANSGQTASYSKILSAKSFGMVRVSTSPTQTKVASFGKTFRFQGKVNQDMWFDKTKGTTGGWYVRVSADEDHKITAADTGYLLTTVIN